MTRRLGTRREASPELVFLSYVRTDAAIAGRLSDALRAHGVAIWSDQELHFGSDWQADILQALEDAAAVVVVVTPASLSSSFVKYEWSAALSRSKRVIPVLAGGADFADLPPDLGDIQAVDLDRNFDWAVQQIVGAVTRLKRSDEPPPSDFVDIEAIVENVVERKLANLGVDRITTAGSRDEVDPKMVFVVTAFQPDMEPAFEAIDAAARAVGLRAERVKDVPGDYRITDKILVSIRQARLIVVDLTHERPNVYFELGFARGLGKTVITIIREGTKAHFDVQDWTYLPYVDSRPLERNLLERFRYELEQRDKNGASAS